MLSSDSQNDVAKIGIKRIGYLKNPHIGENINILTQEKMKKSKITMLEGLNLGYLGRRW